MILTTLLLINLFNLGYASIPFFILPKQIQNNKGNHSYPKDYVCNNFYDFSCGVWINETRIPNQQPLWNNWELVAHKVNKNVEKLLTTKQHLGNVQNMYQACTQNQLESKYKHELKLLVDTLGGWPLTSSSWNETNFQWETSIARIIRTLGVYPLLKIHVFVDLKNTSKHALYIEQGETNLPQTLLISQKKHVMQEYEKWIINTVNYLYPNIGHNLNIDIQKVIAFEQALSNLSLSKNKFEKIDFRQFDLNWKMLFSTLFHNPSALDNYNGSVILRSHKYLEGLLMLLSTTEKRTVANYIIWSVIRALSRDITEYTRKLNFQMNSVVFGIKDDYLRSYECVKQVMEHMDTVLIREYVEHYIHRSTIEVVQSMIKNIQMQFIKTVKENTWLDKTTKKGAIDKVSSLKYIIGFSNEIKIQAEKLQKLKISKNNHLLNIVELRAFKSQYNLESLNQTVNFKWTDSLFEVNAYYNVLQNTIFIPVGLLEPPFFNATAPLAYNYGALGSLIGHEISHSLDTLGRHADKNGNIVNWWKEKASHDYEEKVQCFSEQYNNYSTHRGLSIGENIADSVGLQLSYNALFALKNKSYKFGKYSKQLFFISFTQVWCEVSNNLIEKDEYASVRTRVHSTLQNQEEFFNVFQCSRTSAKCTLW